MRMGSHALMLPRLSPGNPLLLWRWNSLVFFTSPYDLQQKTRGWRTWREWRALIIELSCSKAGENIIRSRRSEGALRSPNFFRPLCNSCLPPHDKKGHS
jgi:hypothetical protein